MSQCHVFFLIWLTEFPWQNKNKSTNNMSIQLLLAINFSWQIIQIVSLSNNISLRRGNKLLKVGLPHGFYCSSIKEDDWYFEWFSPSVIPITKFSLSCRYSLPKVIRSCQFSHILRHIRIMIVTTFSCSLLLIKLNVISVMMLVEKNVSFISHIGLEKKYLLNC